MLSVYVFSLIIIDVVLMGRYGCLSRHFANQALLVILSDIDMPVFDLVICE